MSHTIVQVDTDSKTGICSTCGPVKVAYRRDTGKYRCYDSKRDQDRMRKYGLTRHAIDDILFEQSWLCAICDNPIGYADSVDHNHDTGQVRGMLCTQCNRALGLFQDSAQLLAKAIYYLEKYNAGPRHSN